MNKKVIIFGVLAVLLIGASTFAYWFLVVNKSQNTSSSDTNSTQSQASKPASDKDVSTLIAATANLSTFNTILGSTGVSATLKGDGSFTVFAPTNNAFNALPSGTLERLQKPENSTQLTSIVKYHAVTGSLLASQLTNGQRLKTLNDQEVVVALADNNVYITDAKGGKALVTKSDIKAKNGVIHTVDAVLLPQ